MGDLDTILDLEDVMIANALCDMADYYEKEKTKEGDK